MSKIICAIHVFDMNKIPFNRGLKDVGGAITDPREKTDLIITTIESYLSHDPGVDCKFVIVNQGTDNKYTQAYLSQLQRRGHVDVANAPDVVWPGPFGSRHFMWNAYPDYDYYFETDSDNLVMQDKWLKFLMKRMYDDPQIGLLGAYLDREGYQAPSTVDWITKEGITIDPPIIKYNSGTFTLIPKHIFQGFDKYWGKKWFNQGKNYHEWTAVMGELYFAFRVEQLGYKNMDLLNDYTDLLYSLLVPDSKFPNMTVGSVDEYPTKPFICPFFNTYLAQLAPEKLKWIKSHYKDCTKVTGEINKCQWITRSI